MTSGLHSYLPCTKAGLLQHDNFSDTVHSIKISKRPVLFNAEIIFFPPHCKTDTQTHFASKIINNNNSKFKFKFSWMSRRKEGKFWRLGYRYIRNETQVQSTCESYHSYCFLFSILFKQMCLLFQYLCLVSQISVIAWISYWDGCAK